jgi:predicted dehydrogenase/nucleoside-diphosphate-sugar epimerase
LRPASRSRSILFESRETTLTTKSAPQHPGPSAPSERRGNVTGRTAVALVGTGFIADAHVQALRATKNVRIVAVCDPQRERAEGFARRHGVRAVYASVAEMAAAGGIDAVHVLVPPSSHVAVAAECLASGWHVFVEKPLALDSAGVDELRAAAARAGRVLAVNHNQTFHPSIRKLQNHLHAGRLGRLEHVAIQHHVPLRQLQTGDVGHFMFQTEANILLEQGVHLFSMVFALMGPCRAVQASTGVRRVLPNGVRFVEEWLLRLECERGTASVRMAFGRAWQESTLQAIGTDGAALIDLQRSACWLRRKTRWLDFLDHGRNLASGAVHLGARAIGAVAGYGLGLFGLRYPDDPFLRGMRGSIRAFHAAVRGAELPDALSPEAASCVVEACEMAARAAGVRTDAPAAAVVPEPGPARPGEVCVVGGTGLLGTRCVALLRAAGRPVTMLVRKPQLLSAEQRDGSVRVFAGDAAEPAALAAAFGGCERVLHLATAAGDDAAAVERVMRDAVAAAADAARAAGVKRFVYASSTAALWLGGEGVADGAAATDPKPRSRASYARGKIAAEGVLREQAAAGLEVTVVRPAIVVGRDGIREHSGVGLWVRDNHCIGWGRGDVPLPLVLVDDCAAALVAALDAPDAGGRSYNLAGDVRLPAREYVAEMASRTGRDYRFHGTALWWMWLQELGKYLVKLAARRPRQWPSLRDLQSRSFRTSLDCSDAKRDLGFRPETDRARFLQRVFDESPR